MGGAKLSVFGFVLGMYTVVAGLGISLLVRSVGQLIEARGRIRHYWVHSAFVATLFVAQIVAWYSLWRFSDHAPWTALEVLLLPSVPILLYLTSYLAVPQIEAGRSYQLREHYFANARWTQALLLGAVLLWALGQRYLAPGSDAQFPHLLRLLVPLSLIPGTLTRNAYVHGAQAVCLLLLIAAAIVYAAVPIG